MQWNEAIRFAFEEQNEEFLFVNEYATPNYLLCLNEITTELEWKGNPESACKISLIRNNTEVASCIPHTGPESECNDTVYSCKLHEEY